jgi:hypothetical protein
LPSRRGLLEMPRTFSDMVDPRLTIRRSEDHAQKQQQHPCGNATQRDL